jgi:hypothetical protein
MRLTYRAVGVGILLVTLLVGCGAPSRQDTPTDPKAGRPAGIHVRKDKVMPTGNQPPPLPKPPP